MNEIYQTLLFAHVFVGFLSLITFWIPVLSKKGSRVHVRTGHWYAKAMYGVGFTAVLLAAVITVDPLGTKFPGQQFSIEKQAEIMAEIKDIALFLFAIAILTITNVRTGLLTLRTKRDHRQLRAVNNLALNAVLLLVAILLVVRATGNSPLSVLFYVFAALCGGNAIGNFRYIFKATVTRTDRIVAHLSNMIGAGIGAHTAFGLFGASRLIKHLLVGYWALVPWILPGVVGGLIIAHQTRKYRQAEASKVKKSSQTPTTASVSQS